MLSSGGVISSDVENMLKVWAAIHDTLIHDATTGGIRVPQASKPHDYVHSTPSQTVQGVAFTFVRSVAPLLGHKKLCLLEYGMGVEDLDVLASELPDLHLMRKDYGMNQQLGEEWW